MSNRSSPRRRGLGLAALALGACAAPTPRSSNPPRASDAYCAVASLPDLDAWAGDVVTRCTVDEADPDLARCTASRVRSDGALDPLSLPMAPPFVRAVPVEGGRLALLLADGRLVLADGRGEETRTLATWASDPWASDDGARLAWVGLVDPSATYELGVPTQIVVQAIDDAAPRVVAVDGLAGAPRPIPGSDEVLFVSARTGVASLWTGAPGRDAVQRTNAGLTDVMPGFVPVADRELTWVDGALFYAGAEFDRTAIWRFDPVSGEAREVGPGRWPRRDGAGGVVASLGASDPCSARYDAGGTP